MSDSPIEKSDIKDLLDKYWEADRRVDAEFERILVYIRERLNPRARDLWWECQACQKIFPLAKEIKTGIVLEIYSVHPSSAVRSQEDIAKIEALVDEMNVAFGIEFKRYKASIEHMLLFKVGW